MSHIYCNCKPKDYNASVMYVELLKFLFFFSLHMFCAMKTESQKPSNNSRTFSLYLVVLPAPRRPYIEQNDHHIRERDRAYIWSCQWLESWAQTTSPGSRKDRSYRSLPIYHCWVEMHLEITSGRPVMYRVMAGPNVTTRFWDSN
jgi:hypothetical protein